MQEIIFRGVQEIFSGVQEFRSDASLRSSDDSFDYDARCRGGVCPPEDTEHTHSSGQADPAPTENQYPAGLTHRMGKRAAWPPTLGEMALSEEMQNPLRTRFRSNEAKAECV